MLFLSSNYRFTMPFGKRKIYLGRQTKEAKRRKEHRLKHADERLEKVAKLPKLSFSRPYCTICKRFQTKEEELDTNVYENDDSDIDDFYVPAHNRYSFFYRDSFLHLFEISGK